MNISKYLEKQYPSPPCWCLVADFYRAELDQGVDAFGTVNGSIRVIASAFRLAIHKDPSGLKRIAGPQNNCIVLMGRTERLGLHHCGVLVDGKVLHALDSGVYHEELTVITDQYAIIEYWARA